MRDLSRRQFLTSVQGVLQFPAPVFWNVSIA